MTANDRHILTTLTVELRTDVVTRADRLESWKEIAAYLRRSERTVRRWEEKEGLPVHRLQHDRRGSVYAYTSELDGWRESRRQVVADELAEDPPGASSAGPFPIAVSASAPDTLRRGRWALALLALVAIIALAADIAFDRRHASGDTVNAEARRAFQTASFSLNAGRVQVQTGIRYYQEAIRLDPTFAAAWEALAMAHIAETWFGERATADTMTQAKREALQALRLRPALAGPWRVLANASHYYDWDHTTAEQHYRKALAINSESAPTLHWFSEFLLDMQRFDEALVMSTRARTVNPRWLEPIAVTGNIHLFSGHVDLAIAEYQRALELEPSFGLGNHFLGRAYLLQGKHAEAVALLRKSNQLLGEVPFSLGDLGHALAVSGAHSEARDMLATLVRKRDESYYPAFPLAVIQLGLGNIDAALQWLERACDERHVGYYLPSVDPVYAGVRADPRFLRLMARLNIAHH
jgi:Tfp pilus assembly protein PilF